MPEISNQSVSTPVASTPSVSSSAPAPSSGGFSQPEGAMSPSEIFAQFESQLEEQAPDFSKARKYDDRTPDEILTSFDDESNAEGQENVDPTTGVDASQQVEGQSEGIPQDKEFKYEFEGEIGGKNYKINFKNPDQINNAIKKAIVADQLYKKTQNLETQLTEMGQYKEFSDQMDHYLENDPKGLLDLVIEDLPEDEVKEWLISKAEWYGQDKEVRRQAQIQKENDLLRRKLQAIEAADGKLEEKRRMAAVEADKHVLQSWGTGVMTKMKARVPDSYHGIIERELNNSVLEAKYLQTSGQDVNVKTLDRIFARNMRPILELIQEKSNTKTVNSQVAQIMREKKDQNLARVQGAASQAQSRVNQNSKLRNEVEENPTKMFDLLLKGMEEGRIKMKA